MFKGTLRDAKDSTGVASATLTDTGTVNLLIPAQSESNVMAVSAKAVNVSGTTAGTGTLQYSLNGTDWANVPNLTALTLADGAFTIWPLTNTPGYYYRVSFAGTGTQSTTVTSQFIVK